MQLELELLAPAKDKNIGIAAIDCGADALYIAGPSFGAREAAGNSVEEIAELIRYATFYGVKVYVVINTILYESELDEAVKIAWDVWRVGASALIIQDMALLKCELPPIKLFASTQTNIREPKQAKFLEELGFTRLILARELSIAQIKKIRESVSVELESFIHGALCVSYSGQCYMSSRISGRSANRGACMQACRLKYDLIDSRGRYIAKDRALLSLKDLSVADEVESFIEAGVTSFKIEGRLKNISYVKNIVRYYSLLLDRYIASNPNYCRASAGRCEGGFAPDPTKTFNRGYTTLFVDGKRGKWSSGEVAKGVGEFIGVVKDSGRDRYGNLVVEIETNSSLSNGDGLFFIDNDGSQIGVRASVVDGKRVFTNEKISVTKGSKVYRNYDHLFEKDLEINSPERVVDIRLSLDIKDGLLIADAKSETGVELRVSRDKWFGEAKKIEGAGERVISQLEKRSGRYRFVVDSFTYDVPPFYPASFLNEIRREIASKIDDLLKPIPVQYPREISLNESGGMPLYSGATDYRANVSNSKSRELYQEYGVEVKDAYEIAPPQEAELMRCKYCIKFELGMCPSNSGEFQEPFYLVNQGKRFRVEFDCKKCEMVIYG